MGGCLPVEKWRGESLERVKKQGRPQALFTALISVGLLRWLQNITLLWLVVITSETTEDSFARWLTGTGDLITQVVAEKCLIDNRYYLTSRMSFLVAECRNLDRKFEHTEKLIRDCLDDVEYRISKLERMGRDVLEEVRNASGKTDVEKLVLENNRILRKLEEEK